MRKMSFYLRSLFITLLLICTTQSLVAQKTVHKEVPKDLYGFWQFEVKNKGDWNGINLGKNYIEHFYNLSKVDSVVQNDKTYTLHLTSPDRRDARAIIEMGQKGQATITMKFEYEEPKKYNCKQFELDPDIELLPQSKYPTAIEGEWIMGSDIRKPLTIKGDKLIWNAQAWNIIWLGEYLKKEFRALVELNGHHRLLYITPQNDKSKKLVFGNNVQYYQPIPAKEEQNMLYGTWCDKRTNEWIVGFFDKIAVYKNKTWQYKVLEQKKNKYKVELSKGKESVLLDLKLKGKDLDVCKFRDGERKLKLHYTARPLPYNTPDTKPFEKRAYKLDSVTISGYLLNYPEKNKPFEVSVFDITERHSKEFYADIDDNGCFTMKVPVINTTQIHLDWETSYLIDIVEPNEDYFIFIDYAGSRSLWQENNAVIWNMGKNARLHQDIINHHHKTKISHYVRDYNEKIKTTDDLLDVNQKIYQNNIDELDRYLKANPIQSKRFKSFAYNSIKIKLGFALMQNRFKLYGEGGSFSKRYESYVDSLLQSINTPYTLMQFTPSWLRDYSDYYIEKTVQKSFQLNFEKLAEFIEEEKLYTFNKEEKRSLTNWQNYIAKLKKMQEAKADSITIKKYYEAHKEEIEPAIKLLQIPKINKGLNEYFKAEMTKGFPTQLDNLPVKISDDFKDLLILRRGLDILDHTQVALRSNEFSILIKNMKNEYFRNLLKERQEYFTNLDKKNINYLNTLKRTDHLKDAKTADELLKKLIEPYKGKVIYLDFWGTWCGPCKGEMKYVSAIKQAMKGKDVIFMYLANRSPEKAWKNVIKQNHLVGENIVHYNLPEEQEAMLERRLGIQSFPTFMIIDKKGDIVNMKAPRPSDGDRLVQELNKWLK